MEWIIWHIYIRQRLKRRIGILQKEKEYFEARLQTNPEDKVYCNILIKSKDETIQIVKSLLRF